ncbi:MAG: peroxide stress protein YaaA, partial [Flavobacteriaceae bacterium]
NLFAKIQFKKNYNKLKVMQKAYADENKCDYILFENDNQFKDFKNGKLKIISFYAKKARGRMARFLIENECTAVEDLQAFAEDGYTFSASATADAMQPVFVR